MAKKQHRHRQGETGKVVAKHTPIPGLMDALKAIEKVRGVHSVIPGRIFSPKGGKGSGELVFKVQYVSPEGYIRMLAKKGNLTQEIRVVTSSAEETKKRLEAVLNSK